MKTRTNRLEVAERGSAERQVEVTEDDLYGVALSARTALTCNRESIEHRPQTQGVVLEVSGGWGRFRIPWIVKCEVVNCSQLGSSRWRCLM